MSLLGGIFRIDDMLKDKLCNDIEFEGITEEKDIVYDDRYSTGKLDLQYNPDLRGRYMPDKYPVLLNIHGGGWIVGDKNYRRGFGRIFANAGIMVVNMNYCLGPEYQFPVYIQNIYSVMQWIVDNADRYGMDTSNLFISGDSAGAQLAAVVLVSLTNPMFRERFGVEKSPLRFRGALLYCGPYRLNAKLLRLPIMRTMPKALSGVKRMKDFPKYEYFDLIDPVPYIKNTFPETMIITGRQDFITLPDSNYLAQRLLDVGIPFHRFHAKQFFNSFHCFHLRIYMSTAKRCMEESVDFIIDRLVYSTDSDSEDKLSF